MKTNWKWEGMKCGRQMAHKEVDKQQFTNECDKRKAHRLFWKGLLQGIPKHDEPIGIWDENGYWC